MLLITRCNGRTVAAYSFKISGQSSKTYSRFVFCASHLPAALCRKGKTLLLLFVAFIYYFSILTQFSHVVNDFAKKSFSVVAYKLNVKHLGMKGLIGLD